jgi:hypothetical protein
MKQTKQERALTRWLATRVLWSPWFAQEMQGRQIGSNIRATCKAKAQKC